MKYACKVLGCIILAIGIIASMTFSAQYGAVPGMSNIVLVVGLVVTCIFAIGFMAIGTVVDNLERISKNTEELLSYLKNDIKEDIEEE